jgi:hypothetical protein
MNQLVHNQQFSVQVGVVAGLFGNVFPLLFFGSVRRIESGEFDVFNLDIFSHFISWQL